MHDLIGMKSRVILRRRVSRAHSRAEREIARPDARRSTPAARGARPAGRSCDLEPGCGQRHRLLRRRRWACSRTCPCRRARRPRRSPRGSVPPATWSSTTAAATRCASPRQGTAYLICSRRAATAGAEGCASRASTSSPRPNDPRHGPGAPAWANEGPAPGQARGLVTNLKRLPGFRAAAAEKAVHASSRGRRPFAAIAPIRPLSSRHPRRSMRRRPSSTAF